jgi:hypothetical protein
MDHKEEESNVDPAERSRSRRSLLIGAVLAWPTLVAACRASERWRKPSPIDAEHPVDEEPAPEQDREEPVSPTTIPDESLDTCPACGRGFAPLPSKTFLRHYSAIDSDPGSR